MHISFITAVLVGIWVAIAIPVLWLCYDAVRATKELQKAQDNLTAACERFIKETGG
jgi:hypothetical protein